MLCTTGFRSTRLGRYAKPACLCLVVAAGALVGVPVSDAGPAADQYAHLPESLSLTGVVRDFKWGNQTGGHADFEYIPTGGYNHYAKICADELDADSKPVFSSKGFKVNTQARDAQGRNRIPVAKAYIASKPGDVAGSVATTHGGAVNSEAQFAQWFRDINGVNLSRQLALSLKRQANTNIYTFSDQTDPSYQGKGGFFPINGELFGNSPSQSKNFGFTFELVTNFVYRQGTGQVFSFTGDDDVFVFIGGKLVIDIGGVHSAVSQTIELDRLTHLQDGQRYDLRFFFAERHTTLSNFRIDTTINLENAMLPTTSALYD